MDVVLVSITGIALGLAVAMGLVLLKVLRDERQRSDARVALLTAATASEISEPFALYGTAPDGLTLHPDARVRQTAELFVTQEVESPWKRRLAIAAGIVAVIVAIGYALTSFTRPAQTSASQAALHQSLPLELMTLRHSQEQNSLTITGLVHNPRTGAAISHASAVAFLFGPDGALVASGQASLDYATLAPGDESPFVIKIPVSGRVSRYRVGFRGPDGAVIAHVDRRANGTAASNHRNTGNASWVH
jgi:hypothetical protein